MHFHRGYLLHRSFVAETKRAGGAVVAALSRRFFEGGSRAPSRDAIRSTGILPVGQTGVAPVLYWRIAGETPAGRTGKMPVLRQRRFRTNVWLGQVEEEN